MSHAGVDINKTTEGSAGTGQYLFGQILEFVGDSNEVSADQRRLRQRYPIWCKMQLTPVDANGVINSDKTAVIFGKDISRAGISFSHDFSLPHRRLIISLADPQLGTFVVEAEVIWTRCTPIGLYESGCRLTRKLTGHKINLCT